MILLQIWFCLIVTLKDLASDEIKKGKNAPTVHKGKKRQINL